MLIGVFSGEKLLLNANGRTSSSAAGNKLGDCPSAGGGTKRASLGGALRAALTSECCGDGEEDNDVPDCDTHFAENVGGRNTEGFQTSLVARVSGPGVKRSICAYMCACVYFFVFLFFVFFSCCC